MLSWELFSDTIPKVKGEDGVVVSLSFVLICTIHDFLGILIKAPRSLEKVVVFVTGSSNFLIVSMSAFKES